MQVQSSSLVYLYIVPIVTKLSRRWDYLPAIETKTIISDTNGQVQHKSDAIQANGKKYIEAILKSYIFILFVRHYVLYIAIVVLILVPLKQPFNVNTTNEPFNVTFKSFMPLLCL